MGIFCSSITQGSFGKMSICSLYITRFLKILLFSWLDAECITGHYFYPTLSSSKYNLLSFIRIKPKSDLEFNTVTCNTSSFYIVFCYACYSLHFHKSSLWFINHVISHKQIHVYKNKTNKKCFKSASWCLYIYPKLKNTN